MRICIINEFFYPDTTGGTGTVLSDLARHLCDNYTSVEIEIITSRNMYRSEEKLPRLEAWDNIHIHRLTTPRPNTPSLARRLLANCLFTLIALSKLVRLGKFDVLLVGTAPPTTPLAARIYKFFTRTPFAYITYDLEPDRAIALKMISAGNPVAKLLARIQKGWLHSADKVIVLGRCMRDHIKKDYGLSAEKIETIPIGFDPRKVYPMSKCSRFRTENNLKGFVVLYAGNFGRYHNFDTLLDAARILRDTAENITFALVGSGAQKEHITRRIAEENLTNVRMFAFVPEEDFGDMLASADISMVTLETGMEGLCVPSKLYSTMAAGRATLAMVGAHSEIARVISEAECGVQVDQGDTDKLVRTLIKLAGDPDTVERMGQNARATLEAEYSTARIAHQYYRVFAEITRRTVDLDWPEEAVVDASYREEEQNVEVRKA